MRTNHEYIEIEHPYEDEESEIKVYGEWISFTDSENSVVLIDPRLIIKLYKFLVLNKVELGVADDQCI